MLTYFLQVSLCWLVFYGLYYSLLSRETFFRLNRIYLIFSLLCGLIAPFGQVFIEVQTTSPTVVMLEPFVVTAKTFQHKLTTNTEGVMSLQFFIQLIYWLGVSVMSGRFLMGLFQIFRIYKKGKKERHDGFTMVYSHKEINVTASGEWQEGAHLPFSFFNYIFIDPTILEKADIQQIIQHEKAHVMQRHSLDVVFVELLNILFWWNPIIYFYRHSLRNIHEYLADAAVLRSVSTPQYGRLLIKQSQSGPALALANHFIFSQLKKRIIMMTRNRSQRASLLKYAIAAPLFTVLLTLFAMPNNEVMAKTKDLSTKMDETVKAIDKGVKPQIVANKPIKLHIDSSKPLLNQELIAEDLKNSANLYDVSPSIKSVEPINSTMPEEHVSPMMLIEQDTSKKDVMTKVDENPEFKGGQTELFKWLGNNIKYPENAVKNKTEGTVYVGFIVEKDGSISNVEVKRGVPIVAIDTIVQINPTTYAQTVKLVKSELSDINDEATRVIKAMPKWTRGKNKGKLVRVGYTLPIKFKLE